LRLTRGGRLTGDLTADVAELTSSSDHDSYIADDVVRINLAHVLMLVKTGVLKPSEGRSIAAALRELEGKVGAVPPEMEDVHMVIEDAVTRRIGQDLGGKLHTGKSRNDQVATALRMRLRAFLLEICGSVIALQRALLEKASSGVEAVMPGFTHLQHAQPVTLAHHMIAYIDMLGRGLDRLLDCYRRVNLSPMGAAALAGTGYPIDRGLVAGYLGFDGIVENTMDAVASRDFALEAASSLSILAVDLSRLAEEFVVWSSAEFGYIDLPDDHSSTSSIMPQKKNPVTAEAIRAKCGDVLGGLVAMTAIMKALPLTYNLDMQEATPHLWRACSSSALSLRVMADLVRKVRFREERLREGAARDSSVATEVADLLVRDGGLPFREAHRVVGEIVRDLAVSPAPRSLSEEDPGRLSAAILEKSGVRLSPASLKEAVDPAGNVNVRSVAGGPAFAEVRKMLAGREASIADSEARVRLLRERLEERERVMLSDLASLSGS